jgi:hypothetical protein
MKVKLLAFFLVIFCFCSRKSTTEKDNADSVIEIDLLSEPASTIKKLSEIATNVEYISLQTTERSLIGGFIKKIIYSDKRIYVTNMENIMCFDMDGKFLFKIDNRGRGPEEYSSIDDFDISSDNKILTILSSIIHKLLLYRIDDTGVIFERNITLKDPAPYRVSMVPETDKIFLAIPPWRGNEPTLSLLINTVADTIHFKTNCFKYKRNSLIKSISTNDMIVYSIGNMVCFKEGFSDTVFYIDTKNNSFRPRMIFDTHGTLVTPEMRGGTETPGNNTTSIFNIFETSRYIFYWYFVSKTLNGGILFDKTTKTEYKLDMDGELNIKLEDDLIGGPDFNIGFINKYYCSSGKLFSFVEAITLKKYVASEDFRNAQVSDPKKKKELQNLAELMKETDNPVLIIVTQKE